MKATGIVRKVDRLGRIVIPKEIRDLYLIDVDTSIEIFVEGDSIMLRRYEQSCMLCGESAQLHPIGSKQICSHCAQTYLSCIEQAAGKQE